MMSKTFLILVLVIVAILIRLKPVDLFLRTFNTLVHELSHAVVAILFKQKVQRIIINRDFSGSCITKITNKAAMFFISLAGYTLPSVIGFAMVYLTTLNITPATFYIIMGICIVAVIFAIGNSFGRVWTIFFAGLNLVFALVPIFQPFYKHILYIYASVLLIENIFSTFTILYISLVNPKKAGDATLLKKATKIPSVIWSIFFAGFSVVMFCLTVKYIANIA